MTPREFFPHMPDQVFDSWLSGFINERGWPFASVTDATTRTTFGKVLWGKKLSYWRDLQWLELKVSLIEIELDPRSQELTECIVGHINGLAKFEVPTESINDRFSSALRFINENDTLPGSVVAVIQPDATLRIADGHHRLAALSVAHKKEIIKFSVWTGIHVFP